MKECKGYVATVEFDDEANTFHGEVINLRDVITFEGKSVHALRAAFRESVNEYLKFCAERGEGPEKPFSGNLSCGATLSCTAASTSVRSPRGKV